jgi:hypothetical protein
MAPPSPWPHDAKVAVMLTFDFDAESGWLSRDPVWLRRLIRFIEEHDRVWWATGREVAEHWRARTA